MAESALGVADLPAWDAASAIFHLFEAFFDFWIEFIFFFLLYFADKPGGRNGNES
jgi:hypothetical protein